MAPRRREPRKEILGEQQSNAGKRNDAENDRKQPAASIETGVHMLLSPALRKEFIKARAALPDSETAFAARHAAEPCQLNALEFMEYLQSASRVIEVSRIASSSDLIPESECSDRSNEALKERP